jgi:hypothetical protein
MKTKKLTVYVTSDGAEFIGEEKRHDAEKHEKKIMKTANRHRREAEIAAILGVKWVLPKGEECFDGNFGEGRNGASFCKIMGLFADISECPYDMDYLVEILNNINGWVKAIGGLDNVKKLMAIK